MPSKENIEIVISISTVLRTLAFQVAAFGMGGFKLLKSVLRKRKDELHWQVSSRSVIPNLGLPDVLGLQFSEIMASRGGDEGFWEF